MKCKIFIKTVKFVLCGAVLILPIFLTGCWNNRDLSDINLVTAVGVDRTQEGKVLVTVQWMESAAIFSMSSGSGGGESTQSKSVFVESYESDTVFDAFRNMLSIIDKKLFLSSAQILILGENLSRNGVYEVLDFFQRDHESRYKMDVLVAKDATPEEIIETEIDMNFITASYIKKTIENTVSRGTVKRAMLIDIIKDMSSEGIQPAIGQVAKEGEKTIKTEGTAVFKDGKLVGWLGPFETQGYLLATDKVQSALINIQDDKGKIAMEVLRSKGKVDVKFENGEPAMLSVKVEIEANVGEYGGKEKLDTPDSLYKLEKILSEKVEKEIRMALDKAQKEYSSDIFGFGIQLHKHQPVYWKKVRNHWDDVFSKLQADIQVDAQIKRTGVIRDSLKKDG